MKKLVLFFVLTIAACYGFAQQPGKYILGIQEGMDVAIIVDSLPKDIYPLEEAEWAVDTLYETKAVQEWIVENAKYILTDELAVLIKGKLKEFKNPEEKDIFSIDILFDKNGNVRRVTIMMHEDIYGRLSE